jgi:hypothetical protein
MFVVAKMNFFDNDLTQELFDFDGSLYEAYIRHYMWDFKEIASMELASIEEIQQRYFDCDMMINILEMPA